jgi:hypothetical protein
MAPAPLFASFIGAAGRYARMRGRGGDARLGDDRVAADDLVAEPGAADRGPVDAGDPVGAMD